MVSITISASNAMNIPLEQYKAYIGDLGNIGSRHSAANTFYLTIVSALFGLLALTKPEAADGSNLIVRIGACLFGIFLCVVWSSTLRYFANLYHAKFDVLRAIEKHAAMKDGYKIYAEEWELLKKPNADAGGFTRFLVKNDVLLPKYGFSTFFALLAAYYFYQFFK
jgi:hypothetical protein